MEHDVGAIDFLLEDIAVRADIGTNHLQPRAGIRLTQPLRIQVATTTRKVVEDRDRFSRRQFPGREIDTNEACAARNENPLAHRHPLVLTTPEIPLAGFEGDNALPVLTQREMRASDVPWH